MSSMSRREFIKRLGLAMAALALVRCKLPRPKTQTARDRAREAWFELDALPEQFMKDFAASEKKRDQITADHRAALDEMVATGELSAPVADLMQEAFSSAVYHLWRGNSGITCYIAVPSPEYTISSAVQFVQQAGILEEAGSQIDAATLEQARAALEHDMAFVALTSEEVQALEDRIMAETGESGGWPEFSALDLEATPEAKEAADFLATLLTEQ